MTNRLSIALCTYNGGRHLPALLASLLEQTQLPNELLVCDDGSTDATPDIVHGFVADSPFPVIWHLQERRLGPAGNFIDAATRTSGSIIAFCDQDDVWLPDKLGRLTAALEQCPGAVAVFSDAWVVDADLRPLGYSMWQQAGFTPKRQRLLLEDRPWEVFFKDPVVTGATLVFRRELLPYIHPIPDGWMHDAWVAQIAASQGRLIALPEPLMLYRQHIGNVIGGRRLGILDQMRRAESLGRTGLVVRELRRYSALRDRLASFPATPRRDEMLRMAGEKLAHLERRKQLSSNRLLRWPVVFGETLNGSYRRFAKDWRNIAADLFMP